MPDSSSPTTAIVLAAIMALSVVVVPLGASTPPSAAATNLNITKTPDVVVGPSAAQQPGAVAPTVPHQPP